MPSLAATARVTIARRDHLKVRRHAIAAAVMVMALHPGVQALPQGAVPTFGQTQVSTLGAQMTIVQGSNRAGIDWRSFSLGSGEGLNIVQPSANAVLVNRVLGTDPSLILGNLRANGRVFLSNPRGVVFGKGSMVDVGSLVATTLNLSDAAMLAGRFDLLAAEGTPGELTQDGRIVASGTVALVAPRLTQNGSIQAPRIGLAAAERVNVDVEGDGLIFFNVGTNVLDTRLRVLGQLQAVGGGLADIRAQARSGFADTVLNLDGVVQARGVTSKGGRIYVDGGTAGITDVRGTLDASSVASSGTGGSVTVLGDKVGLFDNAALSASGPAGGGQVLVGGNWQGQGPERNAQMTHVAAGARIDASATGNGDGGTVVVWADRSTQFYGEANARGGAASGDGGFVEVSGKATLDFRGSSDRNALRGQAGLLLLDPTNLTINNAATDTNVSAATPFTSQAAGVSTLRWTTLLGAGGLGGGAVLVTTAGSPNTGADTGDITITASPAGYNSANALTLTTAAGGAIIFNAAVSNAGAGALNLNAGTGGVQVNAAVTLTGGNLSVNSNGAVIQTSALSVGGTTSITVGANAITLGNIGNDFTGAVSLSNSGANNVLVVDANSLTVGAVAIGSGTNAFTATAAGSTLSRSAALTAGTTPTLSVGGVAVNAGIGSYFATGTASSVAVQEASSLLNLTAAGAAALPALTVSGNFAVTSASAAITQTGALSVGGTTSITAGANAITLSNTGNDFTGLVSLSNSGANNVSVVDANSLTLGAVAIGSGTNAFTATAAGSTLSRGAALTAGTTPTLSVGGVAVNTGIGSYFATGTASSVAVQEAAGLLNLTAASAAALPALTVSGDFTVSSASAAITQAGALSVGGATGITAGANAITLGDTANSLTGAVGLNNSGNNNVTLVNNRATVLGTSSVGTGTLSVSSNAAGSITQTGAVTQAASAGAATFTAGANAITLSNTGNEFTGAVTLTTSGSASIRDASDLTVSFVGTGATTGQATGALVASLASGGTSLTGGSVSTSGSSGALTINSGSTTRFGGSTVSGNLSVSGSGAVTQAAALTVSGTSSISAGSAAVTLDNAGNSLTGAVGLNNSGNNNVTLVNNRSTVLGTSSVGTGTLSVSSNAAGSITQTGAVTQAASAGAATFTAGANAITLGNTSNDFTGTVSLSNSGANNVSVVDANSLTLGAVAIGSGTNAFTATAAGSTLSRGAALTAGTTPTLSVGGVAVNAGIGSYFATGTASSVAVQEAAGLLNLTAAGAAALPALTVSGDFTVSSASAAITQAGALSVGGATSITAGANAITLGDTANSLTGAVGLNNSGNNNVTLVNNRATVLGTSSVGTGTLSVSSNAAGSITQTGAVTQAASAGAATFTAGANAITLGNTANSLTGAVGLNNSGNNNVTLVNNRATVLGTSSVGTGTLSVSSNAAGSITQTGAVTQAASAGAATFTAGANAITLGNTANSLTGAVGLNNSGNNNVTLVNNRATVLGTSSVGTGTLSVSSNAAGSITQTGAVTQAASAGAATFTAGANAITLSNTGNEFTGAVTLTTSGSASIRDASDLTVSFVGTGATTGQATGALVASLASGGTSLTGGSVSTSGSSGALTINSGSTTRFGGSTVSGNLSVSGSGAVTQAAALTVSGTSSISAGSAAVTLDNAGNSLTGAVGLNNSGNNNVTLVNNRATVLGTSSVGTGTLSVSSNAAGSITQTGAVTQAASAGAAMFTAGANAITLGNTANSLTGAVGLNNSGNNNVTLVNNRATVLGTSSVGTGTLSVSSNAAGSITQTGAVTQAASAGAATFTAGANAITLGNTANSLTGAVGLNNSGNNNVTLVNNRATVLGTSSVGTGTLSVSSNAAGSITQTGAVTQAASAGAATFTAGANAITLSNTGNEFTGAVTLTTSGSASIRDASDLTVSFVGTGATTGQATGALVASLASGGTSLTGGSVSTSGSSGALTINSGSTTLFGGSTVSGNLTVGSAGAVSQAALADTLVVMGTGAITIGSGTGTASTTLNNVGNDFGGALSVTSNGTASIRDINTLGVTFTGTTATTAVATGALSASLGGTGGTSLTGGSVSTGGSSGALTINSGSTTQFGASDVTGNLSVTSAGTVSQSAAIHAQSADLRGDGEFRLVNAGNALPLVAIGAGAGAVSLATQAGLEVGAVNGIEGIGRSGAAVSLRALAGDLTLASDATASSLALLASGSVRQTGGVIQATALSAKAQGGSVLLGAQAATANAVGKFSASATGDVLLKEADGYEIGAQPASALNVVGGPANGLPVFEAVSGVAAGSGRTIELNTGSGSVTQTQDLTGQSLLLRGTAAFELARAGNTVNRLAADVGGGVVRFANSGALTVGQVLPVAGGAAVSGVNRASDVSLRAYTGTLNLASDVSVGAASTLRLQAADDIVQSAGTITAGTLGAQAAGNIRLPNTANQVTTTVALKAGASVLLGAADGYNLGSVAADGTLFALQVDGLQANIATGTAELNTSAGTVTQMQAITAGKLLLRGAAAYELANTDNNVATLAADAGSGVIRYLDSDTLTVDTVAPVAGGTAVAGIVRTADISLQTVLGDLTLAANANVGNTGTLRLQAATGAIKQTDGTITAATLGARAGTSVTLTQANVVFDGVGKGVVAGEAGGGAFKLVNTRNTEVSQVAADGALFAAAPDIRTAGVGNDISLAVNGAGGDLTLAAALSAGTTGTVRLQASAGSIAQTGGAITAGALGAQATGNITLPNVANQVASTVALKADGSAQLGAAGTYSLGSVAADGTLFTRQVNGLQVNASTGTAELNTATGTVTQTQAITAGNLLMRGAAGYELANIGNNVATLAGDTGAGPIRYLDSDALAVGPVMPVSGGPPVAGIIRTADVSLHTVLGDLTLAANASVGNASALRLQAAAGSIAQIAGAITVGTLGAQATGSITLPNRANQVAGTTALKAGGSAQLGAAGGYCLGSVGADGTLFTQQVNGLQANASTGTAELNTAAGTVTQTQAITAGNLLLRGAAGYELANTGNNVATLAADTGGGVIHYLDSNGLTVGTVAPVSGGSAVAGITRTADVSLHTVLDDLSLAANANVGNASALRLQAAAGSIAQTAGAITAGTLGAQATGNITLPNLANPVASTVALNAGGSALLGAADTYTLGSVAADGTLFKQQVNGLQVNPNTGTAELNTATGTVTQSQAITAGNLLLRGAAGYTLNNEGNRLKQLAIAGGGAAQPVGIISLDVNAKNGDLLTLKPLKGDLSQQDYAGLERLGNLTITAGGKISFDGAFNAIGGASNRFTIRSTQSAEADPDTFKNEVDLFLTGLKAPLTMTKLFSLAGKEIDTVTGKGVGAGAAGLTLEIAKAVIDQAGGTISLAGGVTLQLESGPASGGGGSIVLANNSNSFAGGFVTARSASSKAGGLQTAQFELATTSSTTGDELLRLSRVDIHGTAIRVGDSLATVSVPSVAVGVANYLAGAPAKIGIEADLVRLTAQNLTTDLNHIVARYSANTLRSFEYQLPGLALNLSTPYTADAFGSSGGDRASATSGNGPGLKVIVGYSTAGSGSVGWIVAFPGDYKSDAVAPDGNAALLGGLRNAKAVISLSGPVAKGLYSFASPDTVATVPIYYNLDAPLTPAQRDALSAIDTLAEKLRREQIERSVSTENVARDLREGVIVEVGAGPAATTGSEGIRLPQICPLTAGGLSCSAAPKK